MHYEDRWESNSFRKGEKKKFSLFSMSDVKISCVFIPAVPVWVLWVGRCFWSSGDTEGSWWWRFPGLGRWALNSAAASASPPPSSPWPPDRCLTPDLCPLVSSLGTAALQCERAARETARKRKRTLLQTCDFLEQVSCWENINKSLWFVFLEEKDCKVEIWIW